MSNTPAVGAYDYYRKRLGAIQPKKSPATQQFDPAKLTGIIQSVGSQGSSISEEEAQKRLNAASGGDINGLSGFRKFIDVVSQPAYAFSQTIAEAEDRHAKRDKEDQNSLTSLLDSLAELPGYFGNFGESNTKRLPSDMLRGDSFVMDDGTTYTSDYTSLAPNENDNWGQKAAKAVGGFGLDVVADPINLIPGAAFAAVGKGAAKGVKAGVGAIPGGTKHVLDPIAHFKADLSAKSLAAKEAVKGKIPSAIKPKEDYSDVISAILKPEVSNAGKTASKIADGKFVPTVSTKTAQKTEALKIVEEADQAVDATILKGAEDLVQPDTALDNIVATAAEQKKMLVQNIKGKTDPVEYSDELASLMKMQRKSTIATEPMYPKLQGVSAEDLGLIEKVEKPNPYVDKVAGYDAQLTKLADDQMAELDNVEKLVTEAPLPKELFEPIYSAGTPDVKGAAFEAFSKPKQLEDFYAKIFSPEKTDQLSRFLSKDPTPTQTKQVFDLLVGSAFKTPPSKALRTQLVKRAIAYHKVISSKQAAPEMLDKAAAKIAEKYAAKIDKVTATRNNVAAKMEARNQAPIFDVKTASPEKIREVTQELVSKYDVHPLHANLLGDMIEQGREQITGVAESSLKKLQSAYTDGKTRAYKEFFVTADDTAMANSRIAEIATETPDEMIAANNVGGRTVEEVKEVVKKQPEEIMSPEVVKVVVDNLETMHPSVRSAFSKYISDSTYGKQVGGVNPMYKHSTGKGALSTSEKMGEGLHVWQATFDGYLQGNILKDLMIKKLNDPDFLKTLANDPAIIAMSREELGKATMGIKQMYGLTILRGAAKQLDDFALSIGISPTIGTGTSNALSAYDVLTALQGTVFKSKGKVQLIGKDVMARVLSIPKPDNFAIDPIELFKISDELLNWMLDAKFIPMGTIPDASVKSFKTSLGQILGEAASEEPVNLVRQMLIKAAKDSKAIKYDMDAIAPQIEDMSQILGSFYMENLGNQFMRRAAEQKIALGTKVGEISEDATAKILDQLAGAANNTSRYADLISQVTKGKITQKIRKGLGDGQIVAPSVKSVDDGAVDIAGKNIAEDFADILDPNEVAVARHITDVSDAVKAGDREAVKKTSFLEAEDAVGKEMARTDPSILHQSGDNAAIAIDSIIYRALDAFGNKFLNNYKNATIHEAMLKGGNVGRNYVASVANRLNTINRQGSRKDMQAAFYALQKGTVSSLDDKTRVIATQMEDVLNQFFQVGDATKRDGILSDFFSRGYDLDHVVDKMSKGSKRLPEGMRFNIEQAQALAKENGTEFIGELSKQWQSWKIDDPLDFLSRMTHTMGSLATDRAISLEGQRMARELGFASTKPKPGFVKYRSSGIMGRYFPEEMYVDPDIIKEFDRMEEILSRTGMSIPVIEKWVAPVIDKWKAGMTIYHPGHHTRNLVGDMMMSFFQDGVKNPKYYERAMRMQAKHNIRGKYEDGWELLNAMGGGTNVLEKSNNVAAVVKIKGKKISLDDIEVQQAAYERGLLPDFATSEDINILGATEITRADGSVVQVEQNFRNKLDKIQPLKGKGRQVAGSISQRRDDMVRLSHFMHILENPPRAFKTKEELFDYASHRVRRAHPDGSDLTDFERAWMRKIFPFYSWTRKAIPLVLESMATNPARHTIYPKAMYNIAEANGVDPDSLSVPFPPNQLFPSWLTEKATGPVGHTPDGSLLSVDIGSPDVDIMNDFATGRVGFDGMLSMLNPMIKAPIELTTGSRMDSGAKISSKADYIDSSIPMVSQLSQILGYSPTGTISDTLTGNPQLREKNAVAKGNRTAINEGLDFPTVLNRLLNVKATNWETPSAIKSAQLELRNK